MEGSSYTLVAMYGRMNGMVPGTAMHIFESMFSL